MDIPWYQDFFDNYYLETYKELLDYFDPEKEIDFLIDVLELPDKAKILDLCGGHGRHALPLAKRGYDTTILDLNKDFLEKAKREAEKKVVKIKTLHKDARRIPFKEKFDAVVNLFTSFGYLESDEENFKIVRQAYKSLKPGGKFLMDVINKTWILKNYRERDWRKAGDLILLVQRKFDKQKSRNIVNFIIIDTKNCKVFNTGQNIRLYSYADLESIFLRAGFKITGRYGKLGKEEFTDKSCRIVIIGEKPKI